MPTPRTKFVEMQGVDFGREVTGAPQLSTAREWLVTNGIGGYASGTVSGVATRRYHGLLVAALNPPLGRTVLLSKLDETVTVEGQSYPLFTNQWHNVDTPLEPPGYLHLERFRLEGTTPVWSYAIGNARLEKRIWMEQDANTTYVRYDLIQATYPLHLEMKTLVNYRDFHATTRAGDWRMQVEPFDRGLRIAAFDRATPLYLMSDHSEAISDHQWYRDYFLAEEAARGLDSLDDNLYVGRFTKTLYAGDSVTLIASTDPNPLMDSAVAYAKRQAYESESIGLSASRHEPIWRQQLVLAADQFIVRRPTAGDADGRTILAGYHWFGDWGRDTMISLPGLTLTTGRHDVAAKILRTFAKHVDRGMLPNRFPDYGETPEYNTVDATLWYFNAIRAYVAATGAEKTSNREADSEGTDSEGIASEPFVRELFPTLREMIDWHKRGTRYNIHMDPDDGLLYAGEVGVQLTWMDAKVGDWVVTPRIGKAVEINALWYNALRIMEDFARRLGEPHEEYAATADQVEDSFQRFWNADADYCYDVVDTPDGTSDATLRPNQLFAVSLFHSPLNAAQQRAVVDICARHLVTSLGLRSLAPGCASYNGSFQGGPHERDSAYHQGTVWAWLIGAFVEAHLRVYNDPEQAEQFLIPFIHHLSDYGVGSICETAEGDTPHRPRACIAQAWSVAEVLRAWELIADA